MASLLGNGQGSAVRAASIPAWWLWSNSAPRGAPAIAVILTATTGRACFGGEDLPREPPVKAADNLSQDCKIYKSSFLTKRIFAASNR
ncbi:MAG: hypothetical protein ACR2FY_00690 [Pirellulaceae bacterium]